MITLQDKLMKKYPQLNKKTVKVVMKKAKQCGGASTNKKVIDIIADTLGVSKSRVVDRARLKALGADELDIVELVQLIEENLGCSIDEHPSSIIAKIKTVGHLKKFARENCQKGNGFLDKIVNKTVDAYNSILRHKKDPRDHVLKDGEKHLLFLNDKGALTRAQFAGPGSDVVGNLKELLKKNNNEIALAIADDNFVSDADKVALTHDIRYSIRTDPEEVRKADLKFVNKLKDNMKKAGLRNPRIIFNNAGAYAGVRSKMIAEDTGLIKKGSLAGKIEGLPKEDEQLLEDTLAHLEMQGYGKRTDILRKYIENNGKLQKGGNPKNRPIRKKKRESAWIKHVRAYAKKNDMNYGDAMSKAGASYKK